VIKLEPMLPRQTGNALLAPTATAPLPVGSVFPVEAVRDTASQQLLLLFAGRKWLLKPGGAAGEIESGSRVQVRVVRNAPDLELALVQRTDEISAAMRRELPQQANPLRLLANLDWIARQPADAPPQLPEPARAAIAAAWRRIPTQEQLTTGAGLERACRDSGLRLESQLGAAMPGALESVLTTDWKAVLYRLHEALTRAGGSKSGVSTDRSEAQVPTRHGPLQAIPAEAATVAQMVDVKAMLGELAQQARESIARVACTQLVSLGANEQAALPLLLEIPYREPAGTGLLRLRIEREEAGARAGSSSAVWTIEFALDLGIHGPLRGRVTLAEGRVSVTLQPELAQLAQAIDARVDELRGALQDSGVPVGKLTCVRSDPLATDSTGSWLVNLRA
jgi:hypothetical protein